MTIPNINLLSPEKRQHVRHMGALQFVKNILEIGLTVLSLVSIVLVGGWWVLQQHFRDLTSQLATEADTYSLSNKRIHAVNEVLSQADDLQKNYVLWVPFLTQISTALPSGVTLTNFGLNFSNTSVGFVGVAKTRDDLLLFEEKMEELPFIGDVVIPLSQLAEKEQISFSLLADLQLPDHKKKK